MEPPGAVLEDHAVALRNGLIEAVLPRAEAEARYPQYTRISLGEHVLIPGLVKVSPAPENPESMAEAARVTGLRAAIALPVKEAASAYAADPDDYLAKGLALRDRYRDHAFISFCLAPVAASDATLRKVAKLAAEVQVAVHVSGTPIERLAGLGLLGPEWSVVDPGSLDEREITLLARNGVSVVHCPPSRAPVARLAARGVNVALGAAGDLLGVLRIAALPAPAALRAATLGAARALGLDRRIGSIAPGKAADLAALRLERPVFEDPLSHLVYIAGEQHVSDVWIEGKHLVCQGNRE